MKDIRAEFTVGEKTYGAVFNLNVMNALQEKYKTVDEWGKLTDGSNGEPNIGALVYGYTQMINEAIDIDNDTAEVKKTFLTEKQVGRILTAYGMENAVKKLNNTVIESTKSEEKNE